MFISEEAYKSLGFKRPEFVQNAYGITIYLGTKDKDDWCINIPKRLAKLKCPTYPFNCDYAVYFVTEENVLEIAREFTRLAERIKQK